MKKRLGERILSTIIPGRDSEEEMGTGNKNTGEMNQPGMKANVGDSYIYNVNTGTLKIYTNEGSLDWRYDLSVNFDYSVVKKIRIKEDVTYLSDNAFEGCTALDTIHLPESLVNIGARAFSGCVGMKQFEIPRSVTIIGAHAFSGCGGLEQVTICGNNPATLKEEVFPSDNLKMKIYVPSEAVKIYKEADRWAAYRDKITSVTYAADQVADAARAVNEWQESYQASEETWMEDVAGELQGILPVDVSAQWKEDVDLSTVSGEGAKGGERKELTGTLVISCQDAKEEILLHLAVMETIQMEEEVSDVDWMETDEDAADIAENLADMDDEDDFWEKRRPERKQKKETADYVFLAVCSVVFVGLAAIIRKLLKKK